MEGVHDELQALASRRRQVVAELALVLVVSAAALEVVPAVVAAGPEARTVFLTLLALFGWAASGAFGRLLTVLETPCPRCGDAFHGARWPGACASCGLALRDRRTGG